MSTVPRVQRTSAQGRAPVRDIALAAGVAVIGQAEVWLPSGEFANIVGPRSVNALGYLLASAALAWRRRAPVGVLAVVVAVSAVQYLLIGASQGLGSFLPLLVAFYTAGRECSPAAIWRAGGLAVIGVAVHEARDPQFEFSGATVTFWLILAAAWPIGQAFRARQLHSEALAERADHLELERQAQARAAAAAERARIARELHDVIGHGLSVIVVQASAVDGDLNGAGPGETRRRVAAIEQTARQSLAEMRRLVGLLDEDEPTLSPQPSLASVGDLVEQIRSAGTPVEFRLEGQPCRLPSGLDLTGYRIVQEALTNTLKHAGPASVMVTIRYDPDSLVVEVTDDGQAAHGATASDATAPGRGLIGMHERVALYGGSLEAGPRCHGGYRVAARLPISESVT